MLQITPQMKVLVAVEPADFRCGIDGLAALCKKSLAQDPFTGTVFVFRNRRATSIKVLVYDGQGFWLCQKRLTSHIPPRQLLPRTNWQCFSPLAIPAARQRRRIGAPSAAARKATEKTALASDTRSVVH